MEKMWRKRFNDELFLFEFAFKNKKFRKTHRRKTSVKRFLPMAPGRRSLTGWAACKNIDRFSNKKIYLDFPKVN